MQSPAGTTSGMIRALLAGAALGGFIGMIGGFIFTAIFLETPSAEVNELSMGALGMARSALVVVTVLFAAVVGAGLGAGVGAVLASRSNKNPPDAGIIFTNKEPNHDSST